MKSQPLSLLEGIFLEDSGNILKWGTSFIDLQNIDDPIIIKNEKIIKWKNKICLGGLMLDIFIQSDNYTNSDGKLRFIRLDTNENDVWKNYHSLHSHFNKLFDKPTKEKLDGKYPLTTWKQKDILISIGVAEKFTEYLIFAIEKKDSWWKSLRKNVR